MEAELRLSGLWLWMESFCESVGGIGDRLQICRWGNDAGFLVVMTQRAYASFGPERKIALNRPVTLSISLPILLRTVIYEPVGYSVCHTQEVNPRKINSHVVSQFINSLINQYISLSFRYDFEMNFKVT